MANKYEPSPYKAFGISSRLCSKKKKKRIDNLPTKKDIYRLHKKGRSGKLNYKFKNSL